MTTHTIGSGVSSVVVKYTDTSVIKILPLDNNSDLIDFCSEVYALIKLSRLSICPKFYSAHISDVYNNVKPEIYFEHGHDLGFGFITMEKLDGNLAEYKTKYTLTHGDKEIILFQLLKKFNLMLNHKFLYNDISENNILYKKNGTETLWFFGDMFIYTFNQFLRNREDANKRILEKQKHDKHLYRNVTIVSPEEELDREIKNSINMLYKLLDL